MKILLIALSLVRAVVPAAFSAPAEPVAIKGTLAWPPTLATEPFTVIHAADGRFAHA